MKKREGRRTAKAEFREEVFGPDRCPHCRCARGASQMYPNWKCGTLHDGKRMVQSGPCRVMEEQAEKVRIALDAVREEAERISVQVEDGRVLSLFQYLRLANGVKQ